MTRPRITCHMITSLDGRLLADRWPVTVDRLMEVYDHTGDQLNAQGWIVGRTTMEHYVPTGDATSGPVAIPRPDRLEDAGDANLAICFDRDGRLRPESGDLDGDHLVLVVSEKVSDAHVETLVETGVSVVFAGPDGIDIKSALERIGTGFDRTHLLLEGGGVLNGAFLEAGVISETSTLIYPVLDGQSGVPAIYDRAETTVHSLKLIDSTTQQDGTVWLRHRVLYDAA